MSPLVKRGAAAFAAFAVLAALAASALSGGSGNASAFTGSAECMIVIERDSGRVLNEKNADRRRPMASTTKIATAITVIEHTPDLDKTVKVPAAAVGVEGSSIYLTKDEPMTIRDLLYGLMLQSGNDCAVALAITAAGSVEKFAAMMNETAAAAGAKNTHFVNPHGLHDDNHYTTARDLAAIAAYAMKNATFREIVSAKRHTAPWAGRDYDRVIVNKNKILSSYEGGDGIKTGYTKKAGRCLVASATRGGMSVIAVVLNCGPMFEDCRALMDEAFAKYDMRDLSGLTEGVTAPAEESSSDSVRLGIRESAIYPLTDEEYGAVTCRAEGVLPMRAPLPAGTENGKICFYLGKRLLFERKLYTMEDVVPRSAAERLKDIAERWTE